MSKRKRMLLAIVSSVLLGMIAVGLWSRLGPLGPSVSRALSSNASVQYAAENEEKEASNAVDALKWRNLSLVDENGIIPPNALMNAAKKINEMQAQPGVTNQAITRAAWTWLGPGNIGGRVRSIVIHPTNTNIMWAGGVTGGIWKTTNGGASWAPLNDFMSNMAVSTMVIDPTNPNILYAGTGEGLACYCSDNSTQRGAGVFKSSDGGTTWTQLPNTNTSQWYWVNRLAIHPTNPQILLAATDSGMWKTSNGGANWVRDTGATWPSADVNFNPIDGTKAVNGEKFDGYAWYSTNSGDSWNTATFTSIGAGAGRVEVAYAPSNPSIVYASVDINGGEIWKSVDGGANYSLVNTGQSFLNGQGDYDNVIWVDPTNPNTLVVGGIDLWRSTNGGVALTQISEWWNAPNSAHADQHIIIEKPGFNGTSNTTVFFGNDGGVYRANNVYTVIGTTGWTELNNNLGITQFYGAAGNPTTGKIVGGTQDNGTLVYTPAGGTEGWTTTFGGDGGWSAADPIDGNYLYGEYVFAQVHRSDNGGMFSDPIWGEYWDGFAYAYKPPPYIITDAKDSKANFIAPFVLDPNNANRLLVGAQSLWRTNDVKAPNTNTTGPAWFVIKAPTASFSNISAIVIAPGNSDVVWVGHNDGNVYKTTNGTAASPTWTQVDLGTPNLPNRYVTRITIDKNDSNKVYVTFGGFSPDNVWRTTNGGLNWSDITGSGPTGLPDLPVRSLMINPTNSNWLYIGTELGLFASEDGGVNWTLPHDGPTNTPVDELFWMNTKLVAVTYGRGLYSQETVSSSVLITGNAGVASATLSYTSGTPQTATANGSGNYSISVPSGWSGTVTPSKTGYTFSPASRSYTNVLANQTGQNYTATSTGGGTNLLQDPSFEAYTPNPYWTETSTNFGTPLCTVADCGSYSNAGPRTGSAWSWFGGTSNNETGSLSQTVTFPNGSATLKFYLWIGSAGAGSDAADVFNAKIDGATVFSANATQIGSYPTYTLVSVDVSAYANGAPHTVSFSSVTTGQTVNFNLDDVSLLGGSPVSHAKDTTGVFRPSNGLLYLKNQNTTGFADIAINYGLGGDYPVVGDWDGNGTATIGIYRNGSFYLRNSNTLGFADMVFAFGTPGDQPVAGDWNGDGTDTIGIYRPSTGQFLLRNSNSAGAADYSFYLGNVGDVGIAGDWTAKGFDTVGVFRPSNGIIFLKNTNQTGFADIALNYGLSGDMPVTGDWDGNGTDTIGVYRNAQFLLRNSNTVGFADLVFGLGIPGDMPIAGDWNGVP